MSRIHELGKNYSKQKQFLPEACPTLYSLIFYTLQLDFENRVDQEPEKQMHAVEGCP